jgi:hypothetical protein
MALTGIRQSQNWIRAIRRPGLAEMILPCSMNGKFMAEMIKLKRLKFGTEHAYNARWGKNGHRLVQIDHSRHDQKREKTNG